VAALSGLVSEGESFGSVEREWRSAILGATEVLGGFVENVIERLDHISSVVGKYSEWFSSTGENVSLMQRTGVLVMSMIRIF
jgi:hypothetical protein